MKFIESLNLADKRVLLRLDLNVPIIKRQVTDDTRVRAAIPSIRAIRAKGAKQIYILSHMGRPDEYRMPEEQPCFSLSPVLPYIEKYIGESLYFASDIAKAAASEAPLVLVENTRFFKGEKDNTPRLAQQLADLGDVFIMDAFASAHRIHASTYGVAERVKECGAGLLVQRELAALNHALDAKPLAVIMGGAKIGDKLPILKRLASLADVLIVGGGIANTFLAASGKKVGNSLFEQSYQDTAREIMKQVRLPLPVDVAVTKNLSNSDIREEKKVDDIAEDDIIVDIGKHTQEVYAQHLGDVQTIMWNGPLGVFENPLFKDGTSFIAQFIATSTAYTLAGGGDTIAAINRFIDADKIDYVSTGGGAFLEYIEKGHLPALQVLGLGPGSSAG